MKVTGEKKQFLRSSSDIRRGWLLSYMVIFCLPLIAYLLMSFITLGIIRRQTYDLNERALDVTAVAMDHQVQSIDAVATELVANTILGELLAREIEGSEKEYKLYELKKELASMVSQNAMIEQIYIYMYDGDYIISDTTKASLSIFFENECSELLMSGQEWRNILRTPHLREYATWESEWARPTTMMLVSVPLFEGAPKATICIKMSSAKFWRVLEQNQSMEMSVYDNQKKSLYSQKHEAQTDPVVLKSQDTGWVYEAYIEEAVMNEQEGYVKILFVGGIIFVLLSGATLIWFNLKKNYNPIRKMIAQFEQIFDKREQDTKELPYIEESLRKLVVQLQHNQREMREQMELIRQAYLTCFLLGQVPTGVSVDEELRVLGFEGPAQYSVFILDEGGDGRAKEACEKLSIGLQENCLYFGYGVELNGHVVFIVDAESGDQESEGKLKELLEEAYSGARMSKSREYAGGSNLKYAYEEAQYVLNSIPQGEKGLQTLADIQQQAAVRIPAEMDLELMEAVQKGETEEILRVTDNIWQYNSKGGYFSLASAKTVAAAIYNHLLSLRQGHQVAISQIEMLTLHQIHVRSKSETEVLDMLRSGIQRMFGQNTGDNISRDEQLVSRMKEYIDENYSDVLLNVESLCRVFERAPSGVNKAFKEVTGHGPLYYINYRRVQAAKKLFVESGGERSASEVLKKVGYTNLNTFTRAFKRNEGVTPGQYRETVAQAYHRN